MRTGTLSYISTLTDTRRCLLYVIIVRENRKYINLKKIDGKSCYFREDGSMAG